MVKCERCGCWSHSTCAGLSVSSAESLSTFLCHKCIVHTDQPASVLSYNSNGNPVANPSAAHAVPLSQPPPGTHNSELLQRVLHLELHQESKHAELLRRLLDVEQRAKNDVKVLRLQILSLEEEVQSLKSALAAQRHGRTSHTQPHRTRSRRFSRQPPLREGSNHSDQPPQPPQRAELSQQQAHSQPQPPPTSAVPVPSTHLPPSHFRIVWGTRRSCSAETIRSTIMSFLPANIADSSQLTVKKSLRPLNSKSKWWFTIISTEGTLRSLDTEWHLIQAETNWLLQKSLRPPRLSVLQTPQTSTTVDPHGLPSIGVCPQNSCTLRSPQAVPTQTSHQVSPAPPPTHSNDNSLQSPPIPVPNPPLSDPATSHITIPPHGTPIASTSPVVETHSITTPDAISPHFLEEPSLEPASTTPVLQLQD